MFSVLVIRLRSLRLLRVRSRRLNASNLFLSLILHLGNLFLIVQLHFSKLFLILKSGVNHTSRGSISTSTLPSIKLRKCSSKIITRSEERFSRNAETDLVCRLLLEKKKSRPAHLSEGAADLMRRMAFLRSLQPTLDAAPVTPPRAAPRPLPAGRA